MTEVVKSNEFEEWLSLFIFLTVDNTFVENDVLLFRNNEIFEKGVQACERQSRSAMAAPEFGSGRKRELEIMPARANVGRNMCRRSSPRGFAAPSPRSAAP